MDFQEEKEYITTLTTIPTVTDSEINNDKNRHHVAQHPDVEL